MLLVVCTESDLCGFGRSCAGGFVGTDFSFDLDFVGCVGDMEGLLSCLLFALVVTAFAMWLLDFFFFFLAGGSESLFSDLILGGDGDGEKSEELVFCLFGVYLRGDLFG